MFPLVGRRDALRKIGAFIAAGVGGAVAAGRLDGEADAARSLETGPAVVPLDQASTIDVGLRYVRVDGDDRNDGLSWTTAMATLAHAYASLPAVQESNGVPVNALGGGKIIVGPGRHDVGGGLMLFRRKPVEIEGIYRPERRTGRQGRPILSHRGPTLYSSTGARWLVAVGLPGRDGAQNGYGHAFSKLTFELGPSTQGCIYLGSASFVDISDCGFGATAAASANVEAWAVVIENQGRVNGSDASWLRLDNNSVRDMGLLQTRVTTPNGLNQNQHVISRNVCFGPPGRQAAAIELRHCHRVAVRDNSIEGFAIGTHLLDGSWGNVLSGNGGERVDTFVLIEDSYANTVMDVGDSRPQAQVGASAHLVELRRGASSNLVVQAVSTRLRNLYGGTAGAVSDQGIDNLVLGPESSFTIQPLDQP